MDILKLVKIGGAIIDDEAQLTAFLHNFAELPGPKVLVHGGGRLASRMAQAMGLEVKMHEGRRITDAPTLQVATMAYAGWISKTLTARLQAMGCHALGLSGADLGLIRSMKRSAKPVDFGFVGDVEQVSHEALQKLLQAGFVPLFSAITADSQGQLLNTNADTIAAELAIALAPYYQTELMYCFEKAGVLADITDEASVIGHIDPKLYIQLLKQGIIADGMKPKLHNCFRAVEAGVTRVYITQAAMLPFLGSARFIGTTISH